MLGSALLLTLLAQSSPPGVETVAVASPPKVWTTQVALGFTSNFDGDNTALIFAPVFSAGFRPPSIPWLGFALDVPVAVSRLEITGVDAKPFFAMGNLGVSAQFGSVAQHGRFGLWLPSSQLDETAARVTLGGAAIGDALFNPQRWLSGAGTITVGGRVGHTFSTNSSIGFEGDFLLISDQPRAGMQAAVFASHRYDWFEVGVRAQLAWLMAENERTGPVTICIAKTEADCQDPNGSSSSFKDAHPLAADVIDAEVLQTSVQPWLGFYFDPGFVTVKASLPLDQPLGFGTDEMPRLGFWVSGGVAL